MNCPVDGSELRMT
jgi:uncharacterized protein